MPKGTKVSPPARRKNAAAGSARIRFAIPSSHDGIVDAVRRVMKLAAELRCRRSERADLEIALREALANAVFHGNRADPTKRVFLSCSLSHARGMVLAVRDEGNGFDPQEIPDPRRHDRLFLHHGRGLLLMRALMDRVEHRHGGREVVLFKEPCAKPQRGAARPPRR
jgi:serine/threonine-protein kinase RsbW